jgi:transcription initiation factor TFIIIB Brf1 subunit/transcription initiation factor TFIIB
MIGGVLATIGRQATVVAAIAVLVAGVLLGVRRSGRLAERADAAIRNEEVRRAQLDAAARRPANRDALADRLSQGKF